MSDQKQYRTAILFLAIAQLSTFVLVIVLLSRVPAYEHVAEQNEQFKNQIVESIINSPEFKSNLIATSNNSKKLNEMRAIIQDVVRIEIAKAYNKPSSFMEANTSQFAAKQ